MNPDTFRATQMVQYKARLAGNGKSFPRVAKLPLLGNWLLRCSTTYVHVGMLAPLTYIPVGHTVLEHLGVSLRASQEGAIRGVMPLVKGITIPCEACLAASPFLTR